jgi:O-antigen/teichoic acid export membrane protein
MSRHATATPATPLGISTVLGLLFVARSGVGWLCAHRNGRQPEPALTVARVTTTRLRFVLNLGSGFAQLAAAFVSSFLVFRILVNSLGLVGTGAWVVVASVGEFLVLLELGAGVAIVKFASAAREEGDDEAFVTILRTATAFGLASAGLMLIAASVVAAGLGHWFRIDPSLLGEAKVALLVFACDAALTFATGAFRLALQARHRYDVVNWLYTARWLTRLAVLWIGLDHWPSLVFIAATGLACNALVNLIAALSARRLVAEVRAGIIGVRLGPWPRRVISYSVWILLAMLADRLAYPVDALIVGAALGAADVALYNAAWKLVEAIRAVGIATVPFFLPMASERHAGGRMESVKAIYYQGTRLVIALTYPLCAIALGAGDSLLEVWLGPDFVAVYTLLWLLLAPQLLIMTVNPSVPIGYGMGRQRPLVVYGLLVSAVKIGLSLLLVRALGMLGVAVATAVTLGLSALFNLHFHPRLIGFELRVYLRIVARGLVVLGVGVTVLRSLAGTLEPVTHLLVAGLCGALVAVVFLAWELTASERSELFSSLGDMLRRRDGSSSP